MFQRVSTNKCQRPFERKSRSDWRCLLHLWGSKVIILVGSVGSVFQVLMKSDEYVFNIFQFSWSQLLFLLPCCRPHSSALMQAWERDPHGSILINQLTPWPPQRSSGSHVSGWQISWPPMHLWRCWCLTDHVPLCSFWTNDIGYIGKAFRQQQVKNPRNLSASLCFNITQLTQLEPERTNIVKSKQGKVTFQCKVSIHNFFIPRSSTLMPASHSSLLTSQENHLCGSWRVFVR
jgi:hypothetical protein